jgi:hypothetical protein
MNQELEKILKEAFVCQVKFYMSTRRQSCPK